MKKLLIPVTLALSVTGCMKYDPAITADDLKNTVAFLASDSLKGRMTGTPDIQKAADFLSTAFENINLVPLGDSGTYQRAWDFTATVEVDNSTTLVTNGQNLTINEHFRPYGFSGASTVKDMKVFFAGYGLEVEKEGYSDYKNADMKGAAVLVIAGQPDEDNPHSEYARNSKVLDKARLAKEKGAAALFVVNKFNPDDLSDPLPVLTYDRIPQLDIPVISLKRAVADAWLAGQKTSLLQLEQTLKPKTKRTPLEIKNLLIDMHVQMKVVKAPAVNVIGMVSGSDSLLKNEYVVIGAHYDHLGYGGKGSLYRGTDPQIHNGADDNASGTAGLVELAQAIAGHSVQPKRSVIFAAFSGEEIGLLGSVALLENFPVPVNQIVTMINFDMIGRLDSTSQLIIYGTGTSSGFSGLIDSLNSPYNFSLAKKPEGYGPSDHSSFYAKGIPVLFFHTGLHSDYHRPSDDTETIEFAGMRDVVSYAFDITMALANQPIRPDFISTPAPVSRAMAFFVYFGTIPNYGSNEKGMKLTGVNPSSPAETAGLKAGDLIIKIGPFEIQNMYDYTRALSELTAGRAVDLVYVRGADTIQTKITPGKRN